ncbi:filament-like plant protein 6 [Elaeis guineensis]|uniref:filament-like plant protein 6 n=1 Tax=Elaeis guineensis var. tenera TaxID=51953 RepID=UPI003C6CC9EF
MERRSWPWKKKSSEKTTTTTDSTSTSSPHPVGNQEDQERTRSVNYVQVSVEKYAHLSELEEQVTILNEKLSSAQSEMTTKENLVKQHAKVAEEAVSGWEKAEAEAATLKIQLESVTLLKLTAEERASHLDGALKECMKQIRNVKEESEQKLHDVVFAKTRQWEKVKAELEAKIVDFDQELLRASAENMALSRSLQERSAMLMKISDEKSQADADIEVLKNNIQSFERETSSLKYELHVVSKELEIRNEERNMSMRSADVANKQHLEDVKKISKLEAECQRLRGLVRKRLPGPAALAQMKLEVENLGRDCGENKLRRSPSKNSSPHHISTPVPDFSLEQIQQFKKENEFLTARLLAMEEETKMLKEALSKRNSELQASRNMCANTASKLRSLEVQMFAPNQQKSPSKSNSYTQFSGTLSQHESNPPSLTSMSEDGVDEEGSCSESWATALVSELSQFKKKDVDKSNKAENSNHLKLMDDFLEMERLACLSAETNGTATISDDVTDKMKIENAEATSVADVQKNGGGEEQQLALVPPTNLAYPSKEQLGGEHVTRKFDSPLSKLQSRIASMFESGALDIDMEKLLEGIRHIVQEVQEELPQHSGCLIEETHSTDATCDQNRCHEDMGETTYSGISSKQDHNSCSDGNHVIGPVLKNAISHIHDFVITLGKDAMEIQGKTSEEHGLSERMEQFSASVNKVLRNEISITDFILGLTMLAGTRAGGEVTRSGRMATFCIRGLGMQLISAARAGTRQCIYSWQRGGEEKDRMELIDVLKIESPGECMVPVIAWARSKNLSGTEKYGNFGTKIFYSLSGSSLVTVLLAFCNCFIGTRETILDHAQVEQPNHTVDITPHESLYSQFSVIYHACALRFVLIYLDVVQAIISLGTPRTPGLAYKFSYNDGTDGGPACSLDQIQWTMSNSTVNNMLQYT